METPDKVKQTINIARSHDSWTIDRHEFSRFSWKDKSAALELLAYENDVVTLHLLISMNINANIAPAIQAAASRGDVKLVDRLIQGWGMVKGWREEREWCLVSYVAGFSGHVNLISRIPNTDQVKHSAINGMVLGGRLNLIEQVFKKNVKRALDTAAYKARDAGYFKNKRQSLYFLIQITTNELSREYVAKFVDSCFELEFKLEDLVLLAERSYRYHKTYNLSLKHAITIANNPGLLGWLTEGRKLIGSNTQLSSDIWLYIAVAVTDGSLTMNFLMQLADACKVYFLHINQWIEQVQVQKIALRYSSGLPGFFKKYKRQQLAAAKTITDQTRALCIHRNQFWHGFGTADLIQILPEGIRILMQQNPKTWRNLTTLQHWFAYLSEYMKSKLFSEASKQIALRIEVVLNELSNQEKFEAESSDPELMLEFIQTKIDPASLQSLIQDLPYWNGLLELFPELKNELDGKPDSEKIYGGHSGAGLVEAFEMQSDNNNNNDTGGVDTCRRRNLDLGRGP